METTSPAEACRSLVADLARAGVRIRLLEADRLEVSAPSGRLSTDLRERITTLKPELVGWLARSAATPSASPGLPRIVPDPDRAGEPFPPSDLQMSFLVGSREGFENHVRPHQYMEFDFPELDPGRFEAALGAALRRQRHNLVVVRDDLRLQAVPDPAPVRIDVTDLRGLDATEAERRLAGLRESMQRQELPLDRWPWLGVHITLRPDGSARLHWNNNNFFSDAMGTGGFLAAVLRLYQDPAATLPELELSYRDCVTALAELEESPLGQRSEAYWTGRMAEWPTAPEIPLAPANDARARSRLSRRELTFSPQRWAAIKAAARDRGLTPTTVLSAAYAEVLAFWSGSRHFLVSNMITHRLPLHPQIGEVLGNFAALYPLEVDWRDVDSFADRAQRLQSRMLTDLEHVYWSGVKVLQTLNQLRRTPGRTVCPFAMGSALFVGQADRPVYSLLETPQVLLDCEFWEQRDGSLWIAWDVVEAAFPAGLLDAMEAGYRSLLDGLDGDRWDARAFDSAPPLELAGRATTSVTPVPAGLLPDGLARQAATAADRPAVIGPDRTLSFAELDRRADRIAELLRAQGTGPGDRVAVLLPKGWEQVVAVHGTLRAGGAYVPIDPAWPADRRDYLLADTGASAVLTSAALAGGLTIPAIAIAIAVDGPAAAEPAGPVPAPDRDPHDLAYVIYTSGSTGRPKGAMLDHRGPLATIADVNRRFGVGPDDVLFGISSLCFDLSVYDVFGSAAAGAALVLPDAGAVEPAAWLAAVRRHGVTVWNSVPAIMRLLAEAALAEGVLLPSLRTVLLSGDWIPIDLPDQIRAVAPNARVVSLGGATEASIWSIFHPVEQVRPEWVSIPYGRPLSHQSWHVLDEQGRDLPDWVPGQLFIGGVGLALGYLGDAEKTAAAFVTRPGTGERLYRTGDLGRYLPGGDIEFLGRADFQVKVQGFRVEPGEVEQVLLEHDQVRQAAVVARAGGSGKQLAGFVVGDTDPAALREHLAARLPAHMVPTQLTVLDRLPLTGNGKLDRRALETLGPAEIATEHVHVPPRTPTEVAVAAVWAEILDVGPVGRDDDFFDLGGQSFAALRMVSLLAQRVGRQVPVATLLAGRTVASLAAWIDGPGRDWSPLVELAGGDGTPWFFVHPAGGDVLCYRQLAARLGAPAYAFQAPSPATGREPLQTIEAFADAYEQELLTARPHGPYVLAGWSSGAVIALELTRRLEARGERVERLVVLDSPAPTEPVTVTDGQVLGWFLEDLGLTVELPGPRLAELAVGSDGLGVALAEVGADLVAADLSSTLAVFRGVVRACHRYRPGPVEADVTVVRARDGVVGEFAAHPHGADPDWGWARLTTGGTGTGSTPGTHHTLLTAEHVAAVSDQLVRIPAETEGTSR